jgi:hypothetical protein
VRSLFVARTLTFDGVLGAVCGHLFLGWGGPSSTRWPRGSGPARSRSARSWPRAASRPGPSGCSSGAAHGRDKNPRGRLERRPRSSTLTEREKN